MLDSCPAIETPNADLQYTDPQTRFEHREQLAREITTLAGHLNAGNYRFLKLLQAMIEDIERKVSAESLEGEQETDNVSAENVSAETSSRTGRATALDRLPLDCERHHPANAAQRPRRGGA